MLQLWHFRAQVWSICNVVELQLAKINGDSIGIIVESFSISIKFICKLLTILSRLTLVVALEEAKITDD